MKRNKPIVSMIILNYNDSETTESLVNQVKCYESINYVVIVDNCSKDNSMEVLSPLENEKIRVLESAENKGYGSGNNIGIRYSYEVLKADYVIISNPDIEVTNNCIVKMIEGIQKTSECVAIAPIQYLHAIGGKVSLPWRLQSKTQVILSMSMICNKVFHSDSTYTKKDIGTADIFECDVLQGAFFMVDCNFIYHKAMYDEDFFLYNEENCFAQRVRANGKSCALLTTDYIIHHHSVSVNKIYNLMQKKKMQNASKKLYLKKYFKFNTIDKVFFYIVDRFSFLEIIAYKKFRG